MESDKTHKLPQLQGSNYAPWYLALRMYAFEIDATDHLNGNPIPPTEPGNLKQHERKQNRLLAAVLSSVSMDILGLLLAPEETTTPYDLIQKIINHINQSSKEDQQFFEAETITLEDNHIDDFITKHLQVRQKMVAARHPSIADESTTIDFLMAGLKGQPNLTPILAHLMPNTPTTIKDFTRKFKGLHSLYQPPSASSVPSVSSPRITGDYGPPPPPARYNQQRQQFPKPYQPVRIPFHKLYKYQEALGVRCNHADDQCRYPGHPKFRDSKPEANYMYNQHILPSNHPFPQTHPFREDCAPLPPLTQSYDDNPEADPDTNGRFILDSGAHPTHVTAPTATMAKLPKPLLTQTATKQQTRCTRSGLIHLKTRKNRRLTTHAVANPSIQHNLLSVKDMAHRYGLVAFTPHCSYILDTSHTPPTICGTSPRSYTHYALKSKIAQTVKSTTAKAARTFAKSSRNPIHKNTTHTNPTAPTYHASTRNKLRPPPTPSRQQQFTLTHLSSLPNSHPRQTPTESKLTTHNWHVRLNHPHPSKLALAAHNNLIPIMPNNITDTLHLTCSACDQAKLHPALHKPKTPLCSGRIRQFGHMRTGQTYFKTWQQPHAPC